jgi:hypothetical protein
VLTRLQHAGTCAQVSLAGVSLRTVCKLLLAGVASAALLPGLVYARAAPPLAATLLLVQARNLHTLAHSHAFSCLHSF